MPVALQSSEQFEGCIWASQQQPEPLRADMQDNAVCLSVCELQLAQIANCPSAGSPSE